MKTISYMVLFLWFTSQIMAQNNTTTDSIETLIQNGEIDQVRDILKASYAENDEDPQTNYWLAILALRDTLYDDAIDFLHQRFKNKKWFNPSTAHKPYYPYIRRILNSAYSS